MVFGLLACLNPVQAVNGTLDVTVTSIPGGITQNVNFTLSGTCTNNTDISINNVAFVFMINTGNYPADISSTTVNGIAGSSITVQGVQYITLANGDGVNMVPGSAVNFSGVMSLSNVPAPGSSLDFFVACTTTDSNLPLANRKSTYAYSVVAAPPPVAPPPPVVVPQPPAPAPQPAPQPQPVSMTPVSTSESTTTTTAETSETSSSESSTTTTSEQPLMEPQADGSERTAVILVGSLVICATLLILLLVAVKLFKRKRK